MRRTGDFNKIDLPLLAKHILKLNHRQGQKLCRSAWPMCRPCSPQKRMGPCHRLGPNPQVTKALS